MVYNFLKNKTLNKPLVTSLILLFLGAIGFFVRYYIFPESKKDINMAYSQGQTGGVTANNINFYQSTTSNQTDSFTNNLSPHGIMKSLDGLALPQRKAVADSYKGQNVNWNLYNYIHGNDWFVGITDKNGTDLLIDCDAGEDKYPELRVSDKEDLFLVKATIASIETGKINLENCVLISK